MPNKITKRLTGIPFILGGLLIMVLGVESGTLECHRKESIQVVCQFTYSNLFGEKISSIATGELKGAEVKTRKRNHRIVILTKKETIPLINSYTMGKNGKVNKVSRINDFINNPEQMSLTIRQDNRWFGFLFGVIFIVGGICAILGIT
ncbi:MAG: hypothetical protein F6K36_17395 [Symploca sp. SIO3C6]|nr:hypothetical protein [Symploca sp. SIO3C6]